MEPQVVLPGEVAHVPKPSTKLGPGLAIDNKQNKPFFCKAGAVKRRGEESVWLHSQKKRVECTRIDKKRPLLYSVCM